MVRTTFEAAMTGAAMVLTIALAAFVYALVWLPVRLIEAAGAEPGPPPHVLRGRRVALPAR